MWVIYSQLHMVPEIILLTPQALEIRNVDHYLQIVAFCTPHSVHFIPFLLTTLITWAAILLYDYCLTFVAEVESCWVVGRCRWGLGVFYLNRYLVLFGHIPIMLEFFWSTSNPNKIEVSIPGPEARWRDTDAQPQMLVFIQLWHSKMPMKSDEIFCPVVTTCNHFTNTWPSSFRWSLLVGLFFPKSFETMLIWFFFQYRYVDYAIVCLIRAEQKGACLVHWSWSCYRDRELCKSQSKRESYPIWHSIVHVVGYSGQCWVQDKINLQTSKCI